MIMVSAASDDHREREVHGVEEVRSSAHAAGPTFHHHSLTTRIFADAEDMSLLLRVMIPL